MTDSGTVLPFSAISGSSIAILPFSGVLPPVNLAISSAASLAAAKAAPFQPATVSAAPPAPSAKAARRDKLCIAILPNAFSFRARSAPPARP